MSTKSYAVFGHPVRHSLSPRIHAAFAQQLGVAMTYTAIDVAADAFAAALARFHADGGAGANVTLPHKFAAHDLCASLGARAQRAGVVNTLTRTAAGWDGDNTDGDGLVRDLTGRHALDLRGRRGLLLGAGGAARGVAPALLDAGVAELVVVNRSPERADALVDAMGEPTRVLSRYWADLRELGEFDLIVNATALGRAPDNGADAIRGLPRSLLGARSVAVDLNYGEAAITFLAWARSAGCAHPIDGLGMLVEQAADSFQRWHGRRPDTDDIYASLRAHYQTLVSPL